MKLKIRKRLILLYHRFKYTCSNLTVHGPSFLVRKDVHFVYRLIYFVIYLQIWIAAIATIRRYYNHYQENTMRFTTRTDYLEWNITFPSITICEVSNIEKIWTITGNMQTQNIEKLDRFIGEIAFFSGTCFTCFSTCENESACVMNYPEITKLIRVSCEEFFVSCKWNNNPIDCCNKFKPLQTEYGICFSINNNNVDGKGNTLATSDDRRERQILEVIMSQDYEAFLHSPEDVPFWNMEYDRRIRVIYGSKATVIFSIMDVLNELEVSIIAPEIRQCRFPDEVPKNFLAYKSYSYSVCISQCRIDAQIKFCNCTHHLSPVQYKGYYCDLEGLMCLTKYYKELSKLKVPGTNESGLDCDCLPSCTEPDYNVVGKNLIEPEKELRARDTKFILGNRPYQRVIRQVARTQLDLVVAIGNCFGLCFGGSLLSIAEVIYYLCFKHWKYAKGN